MYLYYYPYMSHGRSRINSQSNLWKYVSGFNIENGEQSNIRTFSEQ